MQKTHTTQDIQAVHDSSKGQKIMAALYLVTNHLSDTDPLKTTIRAHAIALLDQMNEKKSLGARVINLLKGAVLAGVLSDQNVTILTIEIKKYISPITDPARGMFGSLFENETPTLGASIKDRSYTHTSIVSDRSSALSEPKQQKYLAIFENKNKRQTQILSFINERKSVAIKDIALLFPDVSEKTIQRELSSLVETGKITKRGSKRWSIYMAI